MTSLLLAEDIPTPSGTQFWNWLLCLVLFLAIVEKLVNFFRGKKVELSPDPVRVTAHHEPVSRREYDEHRIGVRQQLEKVIADMQQLPDKLMDKIQERQDRNDDQINERLDKHAERINDVDRNVAELRGQVGKARRHRSGEGE